MTNKQIKAAIATAVAKVPDQTPTEMLQHLLETIEALASAGMAKLERMNRFLKNVEEDRELLQRLAQ